MRGGPLGLRAEGRKGQTCGGENPLLGFGEINLTPARRYKNKTPHIAKKISTMYHHRRDIVKCIHTACTDRCSCFVPPSRDQHHALFFTFLTYPCGNLDCHPLSTTTLSFRPPPPPPSIMSRLLPTTSHGAHPTWRFASATSDQSLTRPMNL